MADSGLNLDLDLDSSVTYRLGTEVNRVYNTDKTELGATQTRRYYEARQRCEKAFYDGCVHYRGAKCEVGVSRPVPCGTRPRCVITAPKPQLGERPPVLLRDVTV